MAVYVWLLLFVVAAAFGWLIWRNARIWQARRLAEEERFANFIKGTAGAQAPTGLPPAPAPSFAPPPPAPAIAPAAMSPAPGVDLAQQKLLFDAAHKAGEAGEPALAIQLYARLLARYPLTTLGDPARAAVQAQKRRLLKV